MTIGNDGARRDKHKANLGGRCPVCGNACEIDHAELKQLVAETAGLRSRLACVAEATSWDRPYEERIAAIRGMCDLNKNGMTPAPLGDPR
jgi:hypothetical protein